MDQLHPIRNIRFSRPQKEWGWKIAVYLYLAGMGAGSFIAGIVIHWFFNPSKVIQVWSFSIDIAKPALFWGPILVAIAAPFLILDLGVKRRFLYACLNPRTSWVARGFLILSIFIMIGSGLLILSTFPSIDKRTIFWRFLEILGLLSALATAAYTGILLKSTRNVSVWNTPLLEALFLSSALTTGLMGILLFTIGYGLFVLSQSPFASFVQTLVDAEKVLVLIEGLVFALYLFAKWSPTGRAHSTIPNRLGGGILSPSALLGMVSLSNDKGPRLKAVARVEGSRKRDQSDISIGLLLPGEKKFLFWGGIVLMGFAFPLVLMTLYSYFPGDHLLLLPSGLFLLIGQLLLRFGILTAGVKDRHPMDKFIEIQYDLRDSHPTPLKGGERAWGSRFTIHESRV